MRRNPIAVFGFRIADRSRGPEPLFRTRRSGRSILRAVGRCGLEGIGLIFPILPLLFAELRVSAAEQLPQLLPPHAELPPTFWELHGTAAVISGLAGLGAIALLVIWLRRTRSVEVTPPPVVARRELEALRGLPEDGALLMKASVIFRRYVIFAWGLPPVEMTSAELRRELEARSGKESPALSAEVDQFFRNCDERKFSPKTPAGQMGAVATALEMIDRIEAFRTRRVAGPARVPPVIAEYEARK